MLILLLVSIAGFYCPTAAFDLFISGLVCYEKFSVKHR